jgi:hypothetical protein
MLGEARLSLEAEFAVNAKAGMQGGEHQSQQFHLI